MSGQALALNQAWVMGALLEAASSDLNDDLTIMENVADIFTHEIDPADPMRTEVIELRAALVRAEYRVKALLDIARKSGARATCGNFLLRSAIVGDSQ